MFQNGIPPSSTVDVQLERFLRTRQAGTLPPVGPPFFFAAQFLASRSSSDTYAQIDRFGAAFTQRHRNTANTQPRPDHMASSHFGS